VLTRAREPAGGISAGLLATMAAASGIAVANLYYIQPLLADIGRAFGASASAMGVVAMLSQTGFASGVFFFVPLGDISDRRRLITIMLAGAAVSLMMLATATSYASVAAASFFVGVFSVSPQMFVPFAAHLAAPERRGRAVGTVMSGLLIGILASRTASGYLAAAFGWRAVYWIASGVTLALGVVMVLSLPRTTASVRLTYPRLLGSLWQLARCCSAHSARSGPCSRFGWSGLHFTTAVRSLVSSGSSASRAPWLRPSRAGWRIGWTPGSTSASRSS
jgi:predicted MFS family arabinose efflux permease